MSRYGLSAISDFSSRQKRRTAINAILECLTSIRDAEQLYLDRVPDNLQDTDAFSVGECAVDTLDEIIDLLRDLY